MLDNPPSAPFSQALTSAPRGTATGRLGARLRGEIATIAIMLALLAQIDAGLALRGLYADGAFAVTQALGNQGFAILQPARWLSNVILQLPLALAIKAGLSDTRTAALIFSLASNLLPGIAFLLCRAALPRTDRHFMLFPAFVYFAGTLSAQFASVTEGLVATGYVWMLFYLLLFGNVAGLRLFMIVVLSAGSILLHEAMLLLGPLLLAAMWLRRTEAAAPAVRFCFILAALSIVAAMAVD